MNYGLIGEKLGHSFSKEIHALIGSYDYELKEIVSTNLPAFMQQKEFKGINVTIPYKQDVIPFLNSIDKAAEEIGAVNTVVNRDGKLSGYNTDFIGLKRLILSQGLKLDGKKVLILGTGGTSRTARAVARALNAKTILTVSRSAKTGDDKGNSISQSVISYQDAAALHNDCDIIINTTPCGMFPKIDDSPIDLSPFTKLSGVIDVIYNPLRSQLVLQAQEKKIIAAGGLYMLVQQAIAASEYFFDTTYSDDEADRIYKTILNKKQNIVLVGMPGSGKTTVGKKLAKKLNRTFIDLDIQFKEEYGITPAQVISTKGEDEFRRMETLLAKKILPQSGLVIATGGGIVTRKENWFYLRANSKVCYLERPLEFLLKQDTSNRPLSRSTGIEELYKKRTPLYEQVCDEKWDQSLLTKIFNS